MTSSLLISTLVNFINIYLVLIFIRILLTWFQSASWAETAMSYLSPITDPYLNIFRSFIPPIGMLDISSIAAIFVLQIFQSVLVQIPVGF
jgi:YggT family protein